MRFKREQIVDVDERLVKPSVEHEHLVWDESIAPVRGEFPFISCPDCPAMWRVYGEGGESAPERYQAHREKHCKGTDAEE